MPLAPSYSQQQYRIARETGGYGVAPASGWRQVNSARLMLTPVLETEEFIASGASIPTVSALNDDFTEMELEGKADYNFVHYPLGSLLGPATVSTPGGATNAREWLFGWDGRTPYVPVSFAMQVGFPGDAEQALGCLFNGLTIDGSREGMDFSSSAFGLKSTNGVVMGGITREQQTVTITGAPTGGTFTLTFMDETTANIDWDATAAEVVAALEALQGIGVGGVTATGGPLPGTPVVVTFTGANAYNVPQMTAAHAFTGGTSPNVAVTTSTPFADAGTDIGPSIMFPLHFSLFMDPAWASLGSTRMLHVYEMDWGFEEKFERTRPINRLLTSDSYVETAEQEHQITLTMAVDSTQKALLANIRAGQMKFLRLEAQGPEIEAGQPYYFRLDVAAFIKEFGAGEEFNSIYAREVTFVIGRDAVSGNAVQALVRNNRTAY